MILLKLSAHKVLIQQDLEGHERLYIGLSRNISMSFSAYFVVTVWEDDAMNFSRTLTVQKLFPVRFSSQKTFCVS